uniref:capsid cement protein n=1 Tax=Paractinoplanes polyasparticus TaxID=2856853 RepID=UPI001C850443|nr:capsid cement protein [Actinoplanes polyasparticus]
MPGYMPKHMPGDTITVKAGTGGVVGGQRVCVSGPGIVATATAATKAKYVGVAAFDAALNADVTMYGRGMVHISVASGAITAGDQVTSADGGKVASIAAAAGAAAGDINNARAVDGIALTTAADGAAVEWMAI